MVKPRLRSRLNPCWKSQYAHPSRRRNWVETEGSPKDMPIGTKSSFLACECLWLMGCKSSTSVEGVRSVKMRDQIHKDSHPELGCSGNLNPTDTVHPVNVGTSCLGLWTGLAAVDVRHEGRESRSNLRYGKHTTW